MTRTLEELREYLVGEWKFDNNFLDTSGNGNHGIPTDIEWKPTARGLKPSGINTSYIDVGDAPEVRDIDEKPFSLSTWVKIDPNISHNGIFTIRNAYGMYVNFLVTYKGTARLVTRNSDYSIVESNSEINTEWHHLVFSRQSDGTLSIYIDGNLDNSESHTMRNIGSDVYRSVKLGAIYEYNSGYLNSGFGKLDNIQFYLNTALTDDEVLALYESTKHAYGVTPAERSFSHDVGSVLGTDENTVFATDMHTKNADGTLVDLSGNSNHGTIKGAVRSSGYFRNGMSFNKTSLNNISIPSEAFKFGQNDIIVEILFNSVFDGISSIFNTGATSSSVAVEGIWIYGVDTTINAIIQSSVGGTRISSGFNVFVPNKLTHMLVHFDRDDKCYLYLNGVKYPGMDITSENGDVGVERSPTIGAYSSFGFDGDIYAVNVNTSLNYDLIDRFNKLAVLPLYSLDFSKHPSNTTVYDDFLPYSSARITSGSFKVNDDKLECVTDGQIVFRNAHEFDGDEYVKLTVNGVTTGGKGTVTVGTTTASIAQGSTSITVTMGAGDTIDAIDIQFREEVEETVEL